ncbi:MAG: hypothetical protein KIS96_03085 [Bauldia sp.]|nr:hypothetical protein [Bauldia sp.]
MANSTIGFFGVFGRSHDMRELDRAFRAVDVHPRMVPEAVKLTMAKLLKEANGGREPDASAYAAAAELVGYCMLGAEAFAGVNDEAAALAVEGRIERALASEDSDGIDSQLILLALHAKLMEASVVDLFDLKSETD